MSEFDTNLGEDILPHDIREGLARARAKDRKATGGGLRVQMGEVWYPLRSYSEDGFEVAIEVAPKLRGLVEIHQGPRLLRSVLIVAMEPSGDVMRYAFKRTTAARTSPPVDYEQAADLPFAYLPAL
ncbi:hypothetical protein JSE7799_00320 [Jannaschia seosinensis]|uniref:Uncharacterized protein n=1 Tax=Jannaschia seosinensis TaxID=313367 RepID=A0A0M7B8G6_9RHOB|nr:hypothetical protein [Jannaschia seosinensis]CUH15751.1 hypothetical protein JSE7799_00320 [Jannaschia seosinensis]